MSFYKNMPLNSSENMPLVLLGQCGDGDGEGRCTRRYTRAKEIENLAVKRYNETGKGITFNDLLSRGFALHKTHAQVTLKYCLKRKILFAPSNHKPQQYYPACLKSNVLKTKMSKNIPVQPTGVGLSNTPHSRILPVNADEPYNESSVVANQSLEGYVLPLLPSAPLHIHKIQLKLKVPKECYSELDIATDRRNRGKEQVEVIGTARARYRFYSNGTVMVSVENSDSPLKLEDEVDLSRLFVFFGQVRDRLVAFLMDKHERLVPDMLDWELTQCDLNKDVRVSDWLQYTAVKVQVKHFGHLLRIYIKSMGKDTVCRVEESVNPKAKSSSSAIETVRNIFNPFGAIENKIFELARKVDVLCDCMVSSSSGGTASSSNNNGIGNLTSSDDVSNESRRSSE